MGKVLMLSSAPILKGQKLDALAKAGLQITLEPSYAEATQKFDHDKFDLIVIDDKLHGSDIYQTCRQVRQSSESPIILLGRKTDKEMWARVEELGFDYYFKKPVEPQELVNRMKVILSIVSTSDKVRGAPGKKAGVLPKAEALALPKEAEPGTISSQLTSELKPLPEAPSKIWQNAKVLNMVDTLMKGKLTEITPVIDLGLKDGFAYPQADAIIETTGRETAKVLECLADEDILLRKPFEKLLLSPDGSAQLIPVERCPYCDSANLSKGQVLEHFACGYVGLDEDFKTNMRYSCPKCKKELKLIGTDYRSSGFRYRCGDCNEVFPLPTIKYRCLQTGKTCSFEELEHFLLYSYRLNESKRDWLDVELGPKARLIDLLKRRGYQVEELAHLQGRSGATHTIDILASKDDGITKHTMAVGIIAVPPDESEVPIDKLFNFDTKAYDIGIHDKVLIAIPKMTAEAKKFAERQRIRVFEAAEFRALFSKQAAEVPATDMAEEIRQVEEVELELAKADPKAWLIRLLKNRGYEVTERARVRGKSGAEHMLDIYAQRDEVIVTHTLAAAITIAEEGQEIGIDEISQFDTKTYDADIRHKVFIAIPKLSPAARQLAKQQGIKVVEVGDQRGLE